MKRRDFLKRSGIAIAGISILKNSIIKANGVESHSKVKIFSLNDETLRIKVVNKSAFPIKDVMLFGAEKDFIDANLNKNITISVSESSHIKIKTGLLQSPIHISGLKYEVTTFEQFNNILYFISEAGSRMVTEPLYPLKYRSSRDLLDTQIDIPLFEYLATANTYMKFDIRGNETVIFTFGIIK